MTSFIDLVGVSWTDFSVNTKRNEENHYLVLTHNRISGNSDNLRVKGMHPVQSLHCEQSHLARLQ